MKWNRTEPEPTPEQLAAWADGEMDRPDAERVEAWLAAHPDAEREVEPRLVRLFRDYPPPEPSERAWQATLAGISGAVSAHTASRHPWRLRLLMGLLATAAAVVGGVVLARIGWPDRPVREPSREVVNQRPKPPPGPDDSDEPFPVATMSEVNIISIDAEDADRVVMGRPLMGPVEFAAPHEIEIVKLEPHPEYGSMPWIQVDPEGPMIVMPSAGSREP